MNSTWWRSAKDVDSDQAKIYSLPPGGKHLIQGPPGSGKTNVLLLRAIYLAQSGKPNLKVLSFGSSLVEFIRTGARENGKIPEERIQTLAGWQIQLHYALTGNRFSLSDERDHDRSRLERCSQLRTAILKAGLQPGYYDALLIDEAQDLLACEVEIFGMLAETLFFVGDSRQRIYAQNEGLAAVLALGVETLELRYHYRIGKKICVAADRILWTDGPKLVEYCQYDELALPSSISIQEYSSPQKQMEAIAERLETQLRAYPDEWIGIIAPTNAQLTDLQDFLESTSLNGKFQIHRQGEREFDPDVPIVGITAHSAKGTEFRAVHLLGAERFGHHYRREVGFTVATRAKTSFDCYYTGSVDGSLQAAFAEERVIDPDEVF